MSKIAFIYTDHDGFDEARVEVTCQSAYLGAAVEAFKRFLHHVGHHPDNIARVTFEESQQGLPQQLELPL